MKKIIEFMLGIMCGICFVMAFVVFWAFYMFHG